MIDDIRQASDDQLSFLQFLDQVRRIWRQKLPFSKTRLFTWGASGAVILIVAGTTSRSFVVLLRGISPLSFQISRMRFSVLLQIKSRSNPVSYISVCLFPLIDFFCRMDENNSHADTLTSDSQSEQPIVCWPSSMWLYFLFYSESYIYTRQKCWIHKPKCWFCYGSC